MTRYVFIRTLKLPLSHRNLIRVQKFNIFQNTFSVTCDSRGCVHYSLLQIEKSFEKDVDSLRKTLHKKEED